MQKSEHKKEDKWMDGWKNFEGTNNSIDLQQSFGVNNTQYIFVQSWKKDNNSTISGFASQNHDMVMKDPVVEGCGNWAK